MSVPSTSKRNKSIVHQYFDTSNPNDNSEVKCSLCPKWISYVGKVTSNMICHLRVSTFELAYSNIILIDAIGNL